MITYYYNLFSSAPAPPPKLKSTQPETSIPTVKKSVESPPFNTTLRPTPISSVEVRSLLTLKCYFLQGTLKPGINKRPVAPPPPPPSNQPVKALSAQLKPTNGMSQTPKPPLPKEPPNIGPNKTLPVRPAPPLPKQLSNAGQQQTIVQVREMPPQPPTRVSSYIDSTDHRFHFLPIHDLPPPETFSGFRKEYQNGTSRRSGNLPRAY